MLTVCTTFNTYVVLSTVKFFRKVLSLDAWHVAEYLYDFWFTKTQRLSLQLSINAKQPVYLRKSLKTVIKNIFA